MDDSGTIQTYATETAAIMRAELNKAIQLNPTFPESYSLLAFVDMVTGEDLDGAAELLKKALNLSPGRQDLALTLAQIRMRQQKFDLAKQILEPLRAAKDRQLKMNAESLLSSIKSYEEQLARFKAEASGEPRLREKDERPALADEPPQTPKSQSEYLQEAMRPVEEGEERIQGLFIKLDCDNKGTAYFIVQGSDRLYKLRATSLMRVQLIAYTPDAGSEITCGTRKVPDNVVVTFRPAKDPKDQRAKIDGDVIAVELVPKDFKLKK
jgi:tetratricopeptide (TPR) repeat protein